METEVLTRYVVEPSILAKKNEKAQNEEGERHLLNFSRRESNCTDSPLIFSHDTWLSRIFKKMGMHIGNWFTYSPSLFYQTS